MKKLLIGTGIVAAGLGVYLLSFTTSHEQYPQWLFTAFSVSAVFCIGLLVYYILQKRAR